MQQSNIDLDQSPSRASVSGRKQRAGTDFIGGYGQTTGSSDLLFIEGQLPTTDGVVDGDQPAPVQMERSLKNLQTALAQQGRTLDDVLKVTVYFTDLKHYDAVNEVYREAFDEQLPARTVVGVSELLGGASIQLDAVAAIE
ncbi:RidA family protein [Natronorubrum thiooxidans]|uniref:RidA family protein n=1 Tax=Natronorubrum thiooxidans TaxID=308853 RepID=UPI000A027521|nr:RidA family protein [Natronorubrum thiooxidans]